jgi:hypothetical protein
LLMFVPHPLWRCLKSASIAVLPFANLSEDSTQDYSADGVVDDIGSRALRRSSSRNDWSAEIEREAASATGGQLA